MSNISKRLEEQADLLFKNIAGWETNALRRIGKRIKSIKSLSYADLQALNNATVAKQDIDVATGTGDFGSEMRDTLKELGGSGLRIDYGGGVTRRLDTMVRQNLLWGAKQASIEYNDMIGEELGCDGIEIDWHSNPRPKHEFMQGKQYSLNGTKTVNGVIYESADKALAALNDYGCLHFKTPIILGVSEPRFSPEELARLNAENKRTFEINGKQLTGYECKQVMRRIETTVRNTKDQMAILKVSGDNIGVQQLRDKVSTLEGKYNEIAQISGIKAQPEKMAVIRTKVVDNGGKSGIIKAGREVDMRIDKFTPCLENAKTGEILSTSYSTVSKEEFKQLKGWKFDWLDSDLDGAEIYKLTLKNENEIQGLIALTKFERDSAVYVNIVEAAPHNLGVNKQYNGVGGHLYAIAVQKSIENGYGGFVFMDAKNLELVEHYEKTLGATLLGRPHQYRMFINEENAQKLIDIYTLEEG